MIKSQLCEYNDDNFEDSTYFSITDISNSYSLSNISNNSLKKTKFVSVSISVSISTIYNLLNKGINKGLKPLKEYKIKSSIKYKYKKHNYTEYPFYKLNDTNLL